MPLRENEKVYIKWNNINYFVPELNTSGTEILKKVVQPKKVESKFLEEYSEIDVDGL